MKNKSDVLNDYRVFPRLFTILFAILLGVTTSWFMNLNNPTIEQSGFATGMVATAAAMFRFYVNSGPVRKEPRDE